MTGSRSRPPASPGNGRDGPADLAELDCIELVELVTDYFEGALDPGSRARLEAHLAGCEGCQVYVEQMRQTIRTVGRLEPEAVPPEAVDRLLEVVRAFRRG